MRDYILSFSSVFFLFVFFLFSACQQNDQKTEADGLTLQDSTKPSGLQMKLIPTEKKGIPLVLGFDWQAHRGGRGLMPENTLPAFLNALNFGRISTLEMDVVIDKQGNFILSHEPWINPEICQKMDGELLGKNTKREALNIYEMTYAQIRAYDCGSKPVSDFSEQKKTKSFKPTLQSVLRGIASYCKNEKTELPAFNVEIKSHPEWYDRFTPAPELYVSRFLKYYNNLDQEIRNRISVQSFDPAILEQLNEKAPNIPLVYLIDNKKSFEKNMKRLSFIPTVYSPDHTLVTPKLVQQVKGQGMRIIPWTVNKRSRMQELVDMGVNGIITDYPDRIKDVKSRG